MMYLMLIMIWDISDFVICLSGNRHTRLSIVMIHILRFLFIFSPFQSNPKTRRRIFPNLWSELNFLGQNCIEFAQVRQFQSINNHAPNLVRITRSYKCAIFCGIRMWSKSIFPIFSRRFYLMSFGHFGAFSSTRVCTGYAHA